MIIHSTSHILFSYTIKFIYSFFFLFPSLFSWSFCIPTVLDHHTYSYKFKKKKRKIFFLSFCYKMHQFQRILQNQFNHTSFLVSEKQINARRKKERKTEKNWRKDLMEKKFCYISLLWFWYKPQIYNHNHLRRVWNNLTNSNSIISDLDTCT